MVRRILCMLLACTSLLPLSAGTFGFGVAKDGEKTDDAAYGGFSGWVVWEPREYPVCNPSLYLNVPVESDEDWHVRVPALALGMQVDLFRTLHHPFSFLAHNRIAWDPAVGIGVAWRFDGDDDRPALVLSASPFKFSVPDFWYEAFAPFFTYSDEGWTWGIALLRCTWMFT